MNDNYQIALCTCPDEESAETVASHLVDQQLAACVNILPNVTSIFRWQGEVQSNSEVLLIIKTMKHVYKEMEQTILQHHPYELPEVVSVTLSDGEADYLSWIANGIAIPEKE